MRNITLFILVFLNILLFDITPAYSRDKDTTVTVMGMVSDSFLGIPLKSKVYLLNTDSTIVDSTECIIADKNAFFTFEIPNKAHDYIIECKHDGYENAYKKFINKGYKRQTEMVAGTFQLKKKKESDVYKSVNLQEVKVKATRIQMVSRGDTLVYDASAFVMADGSLLRDLISVMPGAEIKDNDEIYVQGKKVDYLTLNGKDFFKGKNKIMLDNLPYFTVKDVKVYSKEKTAREKLMSISKQKDYVMDVNLKKKFMKSSLLNGAAGIGTHDRKLGRIFDMLLSPKTSLAVFGNANNVNEENRPKKNGNWNASKMLQGETDTKQIGLYLNTENKSKGLSDELDVLYESSNYKEQGNTMKEMFASDGNINSSSHSSSKNDNKQLNINNLLSFGNGKFMGNLSSNFRYKNQDSRSSDYDSTYQLKPINVETESSANKSHELRLSSTLNLAEAFPWGDLMVITLEGKYQNDKPDKRVWLWQNNDSISSYRRNYANDFRGHDYNYSLNIRYHYNPTKSWQITPYVEAKHEYKNKYNHHYLLGDSITNAVDEIGVLPSDLSNTSLPLDMANSNHYTNRNNEYDFGLNFDYSNRNQEFSLELPVSAIKEHIHYQTNLMDTTAHRNYMKFEPQVKYETFGRNKFSVSYQMSRIDPQMQEIMPYTDASNPLSVKINNSSLKCRTEHQVNVNLSFRPDSIPLSWWLGVNGKITHHAWGTKICFNPDDGSFIYEMSNVRHANWNAWLSSGMTWNIDAQKRWTLNVNDYVAYMHNVDFDISYNQLSEDLSTVNTTTTGMKANLNYRLGKLAIGLVGNIDGRFSRGNRSGFVKINTCDYRYGGDVQYTIPGVNISFGSDINIYSRRGYESHEMNTNDLIWNAFLSKGFFKGKLIAKIDAFDMLHQLSSKQYVVNAQGRTESWYQCVPRYVMFSLIFNLYKGK
jgi:hypothetical protein